MQPKNRLNKIKNMDRDSLTKKIKKNWHLTALTAIFFLAFTLRYMPEKGMKYLQAADPYYIFRMSQHIALEGHLPTLDFMRYFPYATPNYTVQLGELIVPALLYNLGGSLFFTNYLEWAQFYPALMGSLTVILMYLLGKELFDKKTGLAAAFFLTVTSSALRRASAGFFEKEPLGTFLMIFSLLFFTRAWKNENWIHGILSGLSLGLFTISWGGSQMLWLLYPILTGVTLFLNIETRKLVTSYTPTILIAAFFAAASNPGRFWFTDSLFLIATAILGLLWIRYLVEELNLIQDKYLPYLIPSMTALGGILAILSPLYSQFLAGKLIRLVNVATGNTGNSVIGQTVQENAAPAINDLARDLGNILFGSMNPVLDSLTILVSPWTFMLASTTIISTTLLLMLGKKYNILEETIPGKKHAAYTQTIFITIMILTAGLLINQIIISVITALIIAASLLTMNYYLEEDGAFNITTMILGGLIIGLLIPGISLNQSNLAFLNLTIIPTTAALITSLTLNKLDHFPQKTIQNQWILLIPLIYITSNLYGGTTRSRLVFLSTFAVALAAGHGLKITIAKIQQLDYTQIKALKPEKTKLAAIIIVIGLVGGLNLASGYIMSQNISGSPSPSPEIWEPSLNYMNNQAPEGSVTLSWWDYGYNFQTLGRTASQADGGNLRYYSNQGNHQNEFLAKYLNSTTQNDTQFLEKHSADYIWLDNTMIGKFSPVSQIANGDNQNAEALSRFQTRGNLQNSISQSGNQTVINLRGALRGNSAGQLQNIPVNMFVPIQLTNTSASISGPATLRLPNGQERKIGCVLQQNGEKQFYQVENSVDFCIAEDPFYTLERGTIGAQVRMTAIPEKLSDSTFVELYIQDGENVEYAEKVPEASNGYIKIWEITE